MAPLGYHEGKALNRERDTFDLWNAYFCRLLAKQGNRIPAATLRNVVNHGFGQNLEFGLMELDATGAHHDLQPGNLPPYIEPLVPLAQRYIEERSGKQQQPTPEQQQPAQPTDIQRQSGLPRPTPSLATRSALGSSNRPLPLSVMGYRSTQRRMTSPGRQQPTSSPTSQHHPSQTSRLPVPARAGAHVNPVQPAAQNPRPTTVEGTRMPSVAAAGTPARVYGSLTFNSMTLPVFRPLMERMTIGDAAILLLDMRASTLPFPRSQGGYVESKLRRLMQLIRNQNTADINEALEHRSDLPPWRSEDFMSEATYRQLNVEDLKRCVQEFGSSQCDRLLDVLMDLVSDRQHSLMSTDENFVEICLWRAFREMDKIDGKWAAQTHDAFDAMELPGNQIWRDARDRFDDLTNPIHWDQKTPGWRTWSRLTAKEHLRQSTWDRNSREAFITMILDQSSHPATDLRENLDWWINYKRYDGCVDGDFPEPSTMDLWHRLCPGWTSWDRNALEQFITDPQWSPYDKLELTTWMHRNPRHVISRDSEAASCVARERRQWAAEISSDSLNRPTSHKRRAGNTPLLAGHRHKFPRTEP